MAGKSQIVEIGIRSQILWIGSQAYPIPNITLASTAEILYRRAFLKYYLRRIVSVVLGLVGFAVLVALADGFAGPSASGLFAVPVTLISAIFALRIIWLVASLIWVLSRGRYYELVIGTSGGHGAVLRSYDIDRLREIVREVTEAINNPAATYHTRIENFDLRDAKGVVIGNGARQGNNF
jgi:Family of unknown function (DUF6232)